MTQDYHHDISLFFLLHAFYSKLVFLVLGGSSWWSVPWTWQTCHLEFFTPSFSSLHPCGLSVNLQIWKTIYLSRCQFYRKDVGPEKRKIYTIYIIKKQHLRTNQKLYSLKLYPNNVDIWQIVPLQIKCLP